MTFRDLVVVSAGNMWRMKLRATLTIAGVVIAIAAFVSMLSFGAGNQEYIENEFNELGLFSTMQVMPKNKESASDTTIYKKLDSGSLEQLALVPGVNLVYPYEAFSVNVTFGDSSIDSRAQALPSTAIQTKLFSRLVAGAAFDSNNSRQVIISETLMNKLGITAPDSAIGKELSISVRVSTIDSGLAHILVDNGESMLDRAKRIHYDSLLHSKYRGRVIRTEVNEVLRRFLNGFTKAKETISDTLVICGVRETMGSGGRLRVEPVSMPIETATKFTTKGFSGSPIEIFSAMSSGTLLTEPDDNSGKTFSQVTLDFNPKIPYKTIRDSVEGLGFRTFSFAAEFEKIQQVFIYFDLALGVVGLIALITASLGIVNTMVMSINERRREIGVLKSLGADDSDIRRLFLIESGVMGVLGTAGGILFGWIITRIVSAIAQAYMKSEGIPPLDLFALPVWLILIALGIGVGVNMLAGWYPAARAARVDPVAALRNE